MMRCTRSVLSVAALAVLGAGCADTQVTWLENGVPYHDHPDQSWHYQFVYHPNAQAYFEPHTQTFYWFQDDHWRSGPKLPKELTPVDERLARIVKLQEFEPFMQHDTVVYSYPPSTTAWPEGFDARPVTGLQNQQQMAGTETEVIESQE